MPIIFQTLAVELLLELVLYDGGSGNILFIAVHPCPLEWSKRLGDKKGGACGDLAFSISFLLGDLVISPGDLIRQPRNLFHIFFGLRRQAEHKIKLYLIPSSFKGLSGPFQYHLFCQPLVDHVPQTLGACLRRKCQAAFADILNLAHDIQRKGIDPKGRQGNIDSFLLKRFNQIGDQLL